MALPLKHATVAKSEVKQIVAQFIKELKAQDPGCMVVTLSRELPSQQHEVISLGVSDSMPSALVEQLNQRVEALMKEGFQMSQSYSDTKISKHFKGANFDPTAGGIKFGA